MKKNKDDQLRDLMAEEGSRGRRRPVRALTLERRRRLNRTAQMLANRECGERDFLKVLREDFGLQDDSDEFRRLVKLWHDFRGKS